MHTAEERAEYQTYVETNPRMPATYSIPLRQRMWIEQHWRELGFTSRSHLVQEAITRLIESRSSQTE